MSGIDRSFIDDLLSRIDIVDLISKNVDLKKHGTNFKGLCPFHSENTPSFNVSQSKQFYHCFGCGASGDAIKFLREYEGLSFLDAIEKLASIANVELPNFTSKDNQEYKKFLTVNEEVKNYFAYCLEKNEKANQYLTSRGFDREMIKQFEIGYASDSWDSLKNFLEKKSYGDLGIELGLLVNTNNKTYDRFRNRIIFPIKNSMGKVIAFGGRTLDKDEKAKYINSPESKLFHKSSELYGLHESSKNISKKNEVVIVEGYTDVISLHNKGINNSVASLGTAFTQLHLRKLKKYSNNIIFCFDGDQAGKSAAWKALENSLPEYTDDLSINFCFLGNGLDPDQAAREDPESLKQQLKSSIKLSDFMTGKLREALNLENTEDAARFVNQITPLIKKIPDGVFKKLMLNKIEKIVKLDQKYFYKESNNSRRKIDNEPKSEEVISINEKLILSLIMNYPEILDDYSDKIKNISDNKTLNDIIDLAKSFKTTSGYNLNRFLDTSDNIKNIYLSCLNKKMIEKNLDEALVTLKEIIETGSKKMKEKEYHQLLEKFTRGEHLTEIEQDVLKNYKK